MFPIPAFHIKFKLAIWYGRRRLRAWAKEEGIDMGKFLKGYTAYSGALLALLGGLTQIAVVAHTAISGGDWTVAAIMKGVESIAVALGTFGIRRHVGQMDGE